MKFLDTPPDNVPASAPFNTTLKRNLGKWTEYRSYKKRATANAIACHVRNHRVAWTEPNVDYATVTRRKADGTYAVWVSAIRVKETTDAGIE